MSVNENFEAKRTSAVDVLDYVVKERGNDSMWGVAYPRFFKDYKVCPVDYEQVFCASCGEYQRGTTADLTKREEWYNDAKSRVIGEESVPVEPVHEEEKEMREEFRQRCEEEKKRNPDAPSVDEAMAEAIRGIESMNDDIEDEIDEYYDSWTNTPVCEECCEGYNSKVISCGFCHKNVVVPEAGNEDEDDDDEGVETRARILGESLRCCYNCRSKLDVNKAHCIYCGDPDKLVGLFLEDIGTICLDCVSGMTKEEITFAVDVLRGETDPVFRPLVKNTDREIESAVNFTADEFNREQDRARARANEDSEDEDVCAVVTGKRNRDEESENAIIEASGPVKREKL